MSRSRKKPWSTCCGESRGAMKKWKTQENRALRQELKDPESEWGEKYKHKKFSDLWASPGDGKYYQGDEPKWTRK